MTTAFKEYGCLSHSLIHRHLFFRPPILSGLSQKTKVVSSKQWAVILLFYFINTVHPCLKWERKEKEINNGSIVISLIHAVWILLIYLVALYTWLHSPFKFLKKTLPDQNKPSGATNYRNGAILSIGLPFSSGRASGPLTIIWQAAI